MRRKSEPGIYVKKDVLKSKAFCSLKGSAVVYMHFLMKREMRKAERKRGKNAWVIVNNGEIEFTYSEANKNLGFSKQRFARALKELVEKGLIDIDHPGGYFEGDSNKFSISERWRTYGTPDFEKKTMREDTRKGKGYSVVHQRKRQEKNMSQKPKLRRRKKIKASMKTNTGAVLKPRQVRVNGKNKLY